MLEGRRIALVGVADESARRYKQYLEATGDGDEALQLIHRWRPGVVILDVYMPRRDGFAVLRDVRDSEVTAGTRVLMLTGSGERDHVRRASELGVDGYIVKPFQAAALVARVKALPAQQP